MVSGRVKGDRGGGEDGHSKRQAWVRGGGESVSGGCRATRVGGAERLGGWQGLLEEKRRHSVRSGRWQGPQWRVEQGQEEVEHGQGQGRKAEGSLGQSTGGVTMAQVSALSKAAGQGLHGWGGLASTGLFYPPPM